MGPTNVALVKLFEADQNLRAAQERLDAASKGVRIQERRTNDLAERMKLAHTQLKEQQALGGSHELDIKSRDAHIENAPFFVDAMIVNDVELGLGKRRGDLVLDHFHFDMVADRIARGILDGFLAANIQPDAGVEFEGLAAARRFWIAKHDADLLTDLIGEYASGFGLGQNRGQLAQGLAH